MTIVKMERIEGWLIHYWWVIFFVLACYFAYEWGLAKKNHDFQMLYHQYDELQRKKVDAVKLQEHLQREVRSQEDPAWVELVLMRELGLVPEGATKVYFTPREK